MSSRERISTYVGGSLFTESDFWNVRCGGEDSSISL